MRRVRSIRRIFFIFAVKKPVAVFLSILLTFSIVLCIAGSSFTDIYILTNGVLTCDVNDSSDIYISVYVNDKFKDAIGKDHYAIWYVKTDGKRYYGAVTEIQDIQFSKYTSMKIVPSRQDIWEELGSDFLDYRGRVNVEIFFRSKNVLHKIMANIL